MNEVNFYATKSFLDAESQPLPVLEIDGSNGDPPFYPKDKILILKNYKKNLVRGRNDQLRGCDVVVLPSDKGPIMLPLTGILTFANLLQALSEKLTKEIA